MFGKATKFRLTSQHAQILIPISIGIFFFLIRLPGLDWGFPATLHNDESVTIRSALGMRFGDFNPHHFDWPSLPFYLNYFLFLIFLKIRVGLQMLFTTETMSATFPFWWGHELPFYYLGRLLTNIFIIATTITVFNTGYRITKNRLISTFGAIVFSAGTITNYFGYYALPDSILVFFTATSVYYSLKIIKTPKLIYYILAAATAGLATSSKYNGALTCLLLFQAHYFANNYKIVETLKSKYIYIAAFVAILFFFIGTPYAIKDYDTFLYTGDATGAMWQLKHMGHGTNWGSHLFGFIPLNFGLLFTLIGFLGIAEIIRMRSKEGYLIISAFIFFFLYVGSWGISREHYAMIYFPFLAVIIALGFKFLLLKFKNQKILIGLFIVCLLFPMFEIAKENTRRRNIDTRVEAGNYIESTIKKDSIILLSEELTGVFGGNMPVFDDGNYQTYTNSYANSNTLDSKFYSITSYKDSDIAPSIPENCAIENLFENKTQTGPNIIIYRCNK